MASRYRGANDSIAKSSQTTSVGDEASDSDASGGGSFNTIRGDAVLTSFLPPGQVLDRTYRVIRPLGEGGMGVVLHGIDERLAREVAIKLIHPQRLSSVSIQRQFREEARAMARVRHPNVVEIYAFGDLDGVPYFVMEYIQGTDLETWLTSRGSNVLAVDEALGILDRICRGVAAIHEVGAIHRDLKPSNILIGPNFRVAVADFGLAHSVGRQPLQSSDALVGTPAYMAPEVVRGLDVPPEVEHSVDIYALGVIAFELLTGQLPFSGQTPDEVLRKHAIARPPLASHVRPDLPTAFDGILQSALTKDPRARIATAEEFRRAFAGARTLVEQNPPGARILVADDDPSNRDAMTLLLRETFPTARVDPVADGSAALVNALQTPPTLAIFDLCMPGMNAIQLTAALREDRRTRQVPVLVVTGMGGAREWNALRKLGAYGFFVKPLDPDALVAVARRILRGRRRVTQSRIG